MGKQFKSFEGQSKYCSKWWIRYTTNDREWETRSFPTKKDRQLFVNKLKTKGYTEIKN